MPSLSILFKTPEEGIIEETVKAPDFFVDLNLNQIIDALLVDKTEYNLKPFFYTPLKDIDAIQYRKEVMQDLENSALFEYIRSFAKKMNKARIYLALVDNLYYKYHKEGWFLEAVESYCEAVDCLAQDLSHLELKSRGLLAIREYLISYAKSGAFKSLMEETKKLKRDLSTVKYCLHIKGNRVKVRKYESEIDYSVKVEETFDKFKQGAVEDYMVKLPAGSSMNHVEAQILDLVAKLFPEIFANLDKFCTENSDFEDKTIKVFDREIQFYIAYIEFSSKFKQAGLKFCYPEVSNTNKEIYNYEGFDLALANKLISENSPVVCNDFYLKGKERIIVVSGPNQGGKTTFARTFGQLHYLASLGCPVPGRKAQLFIPDRIFTHFEKEENIKNLSGKLQDDLVRIRDILYQATSNSIVIINEIFTSTTLMDAIFLGKKMMGRITQMDMLCVCVTFIDELASLSEQTVSMVSTIVPENPALRTYKIVRRPADGLAYAISIAQKYRLTYDCLKERIKNESISHV